MLPFSGTAGTAGFPLGIGANIIVDTFDFDVADQPPIAEAKCQQGGAGEYGRK
ncbi:MAG: hypothetical protein WCP20_23930 [Desulfuromonadales bacterium]